MGNPGLFYLWVMEIRLARQEDLSAINRIYNQAVRQGFCTAHLEPVGMEERRQWFSSHDAEHFPVYAVLEKARVLGWISLGPYREGRQALAHVAEVSYYVDEEERGRGIGSELLSHALRVAPAFGFSVLIAILLDKNPASMGLLLKFGFEEWGRMPGIARIHGQKADHLYFGLIL
jgi:phosphinothricin acetyltransferase